MQDGSFLPKDRLHKTSYTLAGGDISAIYTLTDYQQAAIEHAHKNANREIKCIGIVDMSGIEILNDLQSRAKKLSEDHPRLICLQCAHKW